MFHGRKSNFKRNGEVDVELHAYKARYITVCNLVLVGLRDCRDIPEMSNVFFTVPYETPA